MSGKALAHEANPAKSTRSLAGRLLVNKPGDTYEAEADRVAEKVVAGGKMSSGRNSSWSLSNIAMSLVQREPDGADAADPQTAPKPNNYDDAAKKLGEAFLKTDVGKQVTDAASKDPLVKGATDFLDTIPGKVVAGAAAVGAVSALAAEHKGLPVQIPAIPLDKVKPGLSVKIDYEGPVDRPTKAMITFSYTPKSSEDKKKPKETRAEKQRAENARTANDLYKFQEGLKTPEQRRQENEDAQHALDAWMRRPGANRLGMRGPDVDKYAAPSSTPAGPQLTIPGYQPALQSKGLHLLDKPLELGASSAKTDEKREEGEAAVQRKEESSPTMTTSAATVHSTVSSSARPMDVATRKEMESRIGFDFSKVRLHTDARASASARALGARAYTLGSDVVFGEGRYAPDTREGRRLLAHELAHVVQQTRPAKATPGHGK